MANQSTASFGPTVRALLPSTDSVLATQLIFGNMALKYNVNNAVLLGDAMDLRYTYVVTEEDASSDRESLFFACFVRGHCSTPP